MVKYSTIIKIISIELQKTHPTLKSIRQQISPIIQNITDNQQEYDDLMEIIPKFYRDYWNHPHEYIEITCFNGTKFQYEGDDEGVGIPEDVVWYGQEESGIMYTIHTHSKGYSSYQSVGDYIMMLSKTNEKYLMTIGADGIIISKDEVEDNYYTRTQNIMKAWDTNQDHIEKEELANNESLLKKRAVLINMEKHEEEFSSDDYYTEMREYQELGNKVLNTYLKNNIHKEIENLNELYKKHEVGISITHIPIQK